MPQVVKQNGHRAEYDAGKVYTSFMRALHKRPVSTTLVDAAIEHIGHKLLALGEREISSREIGEMVMNRLAKLDKVAYVRFASVYRSFRDVSDSDAIREISHQHSPPQSRPPPSAPEDHAWMAQALRLAAQDLFTTTPNPAWAACWCAMAIGGQRLAPPRR